MPVEENNEAQPENATDVLAQTKLMLDEINLYVSEKMKKVQGGKSLSANVAEEAEVFYRTDMWPLLSKMKAASAGDYASYQAAS